MHARKADPGIAHMLASLFACTAGLQGKCFFDWLHWRSELVLDSKQLGPTLKRIIPGMLQEQAARADGDQLTRRGGMAARGDENEGKEDADV